MREGRPRPEQRVEGARGRHRLRAVAAAPVAWIAGGLVVAGAVVVLVVAFEGALAREGAEPPLDGVIAGEPVVLERGPATEPGLAEFGREHEAAGWAISTVADLRGRDLLFVAHDLLGLSVIHVLDRTTGEWVGQMFPEAYVDVEMQGEPEILVGGSLLMIHDRDRGRLILSEIFYEPPYGNQMTPQARLLVFDIGDGLALESQTPLPDGRIGGHRGRWIAEEGHLTLSRDGRYVYFIERWEDPSLLRGGQRLGVVDLEAGAQIVASNDLPPRCGRDRAPSLYPAGPSSVVATCPDAGIVRVIAPDGTAGPDIEAGGIVGTWVHPGFGEWFEALTAGIDTPAGLRLLFLDGSWADVGAGGVDVTGNVLPRDSHDVARSWRGDVLSLDAVRLAIPYREEIIMPDDPSQEELRAIFEAPDVGLVIFNTETGMIERDLRVEHRGTYPIAGREVLLLGDGRIDIVDLATMRIAQSFDTTPPTFPPRFGPDIHYGPTPLVR